MVEANEAAIRGAVTLVNEVFGLHDDKTAKKLHQQGWERWTNPAQSDRGLNPDKLLEDITRSELFLERVKLAVASIANPRDREMLSLRFGLETGETKSYQSIGVNFRVTRERACEVIERATRILRHPSRSRHLRCFLLGNTTEKVAECLKLLDQKYPLANYTA